MKNNEVFEMVRNCNLPDDAKMLVLATIAESFCKTHDVNTEIRLKMCDVMPIGQPMRVKDVRDIINPRFSIQRMNRHMTYLKLAGVVEREEIYTGNKITIPAWDTVHDKSAPYGYRWVETTREIPEKIVLFTRVR